MVKMNHAKLMRCLKKRFSVLNYFYNLCLFYLIIVICHVVSQTIKWNYVPITLFGTTNYAKFIEQLLLLNHIDYYKLSYPYMTHLTYPLKNKTIFLNPQRDDFDNQEVIITPLCDDALIQLSEHTDIDPEYLHEIQTYILNILPQMNAHQVVLENYIEMDDYQFKQYHVVCVDQIGDLYQIKTVNTTYYTSLILTDYIKPLKVGEVINASYADDTNIYIENKYVMSEYQLWSLKKGLSKEFTLLPFYSLDPPRSIIEGVVHPFHLPSSKDAILSTLIMTQCWINEMYNDTELD